MASLPGTANNALPRMQPAARLLDVTRLARRAGRVLTGVDRVELAYLRALLERPEPVFGLVRTRLGYVLLDRLGLSEFSQRLTGAVDWGAPDRLSAVMRGMEEQQKRVESDLRRLALVRCLPPRLSRMLAKHLPKGSAYLNVGHSNLTDRVLFAAKHGAGMRIAVMIHDTIPLDFPQTQRPETKDAFREMLKRVRAKADVILCNSDQTRADVVRHMQAWGPVPDQLVAHLGVDLARAAPVSVASAPYFVTVGTIEPRKNHALLLDLWEEMAKGADCPQLLICGARGWRNEAFLARLDASTLLGDRILECPDLTDGQITALLQGSCGLLFPSLAEGYGLPPIEAAALGVPVVCNDLPVYREILGDIPVYAGIEDRYLWLRTIRGMMQAPRADGQTDAAQRFTPPTWQQHFNAVLRLT